MAGFLGNVQTRFGEVNASIGANINRMESTVNNLSEAALATTAAQSRASEADMAKEISQQTSQQLKLDTAIALQAQANQRA